MHRQLNDLLSSLSLLTFKLAHFVLKLVCEDVRQTTFPRHWLILLASRIGRVLSLGQLHLSLLQKGVGRVESLDLGIELGLKLTDSCVFN